MVGNYVRLLSKQSIVLGVLLVAGLLMAQAASGQEFTAATTIPKSESTLWGKLTVPDGSTEFRFKVFDGGMLRVENEKTGQIWALVGFIAEDAVGGEERFVFHEYSIVAHPSGEGEQIQWLGTEFELTPSDEDWSRPHDLRDGFKVELTKVVAKPGTEKSLDLFTDPPITATGTCCVSCSGYTVCGCSVSAPCGNCCTGSCCGGCGQGNNCGPLHDTY